MIRRPPRSTLEQSSAASDVYKRQRYEVVCEKDVHTLIRLHPLTGRTHQLRVHCASKEGLGMPILGDDLYGHHADRLYLHAASLRFDDIKVEIIPQFHS